LMRTPVDNLSMAVDMERSFATRAYRASNEDTFVLIVVMRLLPRFHGRL